MSGVAVTVCRSCPAGQVGLADRLRTAIGGDVDLREVDCMSGCTRPSTVAFRAAGKTAYLFGDLTEADIPNLVVFLRLYSASLDGNLTDARPLGSLREKAIARIPG
jgi:predicted metal-binding protein